MGWTFSEIDHHTLHDVAALNLHWKSAPPIHITIANFIRSIGSGGSAPRTSTARRTKTMSDEEMENERRMLQSLAGTFGNVRQGAVTA